MDNSTIKEEGSAQHLREEAPQDQSGYWSNQKPISYPGTTIMSAACSCWISFASTTGDVLRPQSRSLECMVRNLAMTTGTAISSLITDNHFPATMRCRSCGVSGRECLCQNYRASHGRADLTNIRSQGGYSRPIANRNSNQDEGISIH